MAIDDPPITASMTKNNNEDLPTYDMATGHTAPSGPFLHEGTQHPKDVKVNPGNISPPPGLPSPPSGPSSPRSAPHTPNIPQTNVYYYVNPTTRQRIVSHLPPDHPQMICLQEGRHVTETKFGLLGIMAAVFWFPLGIGLCLLDRRVRCTRCGQSLDNGICG